VENFKLKMRKFADLERYLCRIYKYSISTQSNAIYVDVNSLNRLDELFCLLTKLKDIVHCLDEVFGDRTEIKTKRLKALVTFESDNYQEGFGKKKTRKKLKKPKKSKKIEEVKDKKELTLESDEEDKIDEEYKQRSLARNDDFGILPDIRDHLNQFEKVIIWKKIKNKRIPEPVKGLSKEFDGANEKVESLKKTLQECLNKARKELKMPELKFNTGSKRYRFEFNIPNNLADDMPEGYTLTSKSKKFKRFQTEELAELVDQLETAEEELKEAISPFLSRLFRKFYKKQYLWSDFIYCIAEID
jgi:DNA mismatch repair ATPase MutS